MTDLYKEHLYLDSSVQHKRVSQMHGMDLKPEYTDIKIVPSESQNHAYLVAKVSVLTVEFAKADAVADREDILVCSCDDYYYNRSSGFENGDVSVTELGHCKHCRAAYKTVRAEADPDQQSLPDN